MKLSEIEECKEFHAHHKEATDFLVKEEELPQDLLAEANGDPHKIMKLRLCFELDERKRLQIELQQLKEKKIQLQQQNAEREQFLSGLKSHVRRLRDVLEPLQDQLSISRQLIQGNMETAQKLPPPLYLLYYQAAMYCGSNFKYSSCLKISIKGNINKANEYLKQQSKGEFNITPGDTPSLERLIFTHPLSILMEVAPDFSELPGFSLEFFYLPLLHIVTVTSTFTDSSYGPSILIDLLGCDLGVKNPNPSTAGLLPNEFDFSIKNVGCPYYWAQRLGGLQFLREEAPKQQYVDPTRNYTPQQMMEDFIETLMNRVQARFVLSKQIEQLIKNPKSLGGSHTHHHPQTQLVMVTQITKDQYLASIPSHSQVYLDSPLCISSESTFLSILLRNPVRTCEVKVFIPPSFPDHPLLFTFIHPTSSSHVPEHIARKSDPEVLASLNSSNTFTLDTDLLNIESQLNTEFQTEDSTKEGGMLSAKLNTLVRLFDELCGFK